MLNIVLPEIGLNVWIPGLLLVGAFIGFLTGMFGVGGGFLLTPVLKIIFNIPYPVAVGSGLLLFLITSSMSAYRHWQHKNIDLKLGALMAAGAFGGTEVGVRLLHFLGSSGAITINGKSLALLDFIMPILFFVLMISVALMIFRETSRSAAEETKSLFSLKLQRFSLSPVLSFPFCGIPTMSMWLPLVMSFSVGVLTGLLGIGGGFINFPLLVYALGVPTLTAVGTSAFQIVFASAYGSLRHGAEGHVSLLLTAFLLGGSIIGVQIGVRVSCKLGGRNIRRWFALIVLLGAIFVAYDIFRQISVFFI
jgi:uncharacterized protein